MSRLYAVVESDAREKATGIRMHKNGFITVKWGSRHIPQDLITMRVDWDKGEDAPTVTLQGHDRQASFEGFEAIK